MLKSGDRLLLAVEAKALQHDLTDKAAAQLVQYCAIEGIEWCVLTNGRELRLYNQYLRGALEAKLLFKLDLMAYNSDAEYDAIFEQLWLLSKESMTTPSGIRTWMEHQRLDRVLRQLLLDPTSGAVRGLRRALADEGVAVTAEGLAQWFRAQLASPVTQLLPQQLAPQSPTRTVERSAPPAPSPTGDGQYWVLPAGNTKDTTAEESLRACLGRRMWGMRASTPHRQSLRAADRVCFYASGVGVVATAVVAGRADQALRPEEMPEPPSDPTQPLYRVPLADIRWLPAPVPLDEALRSRLEAFRGRSMSAPWSWFIQTPSRLSEHDFQLLTAEEVRPTG